jgi:two-component sensor histidine kinase
LPDFSDKRINIHGMPVVLAPNAAQNLALTIHELAANAVKYGALSNERGVVNIHWAINKMDHDNIDHIHFEWKEKDGSHVNPPQRQGFGTTVIGRLAVQSLNGTVESRLEPEGLTWSLIFPLDNNNVANDTALSFLKK